MRRSLVFVFAVAWIGLAMAAPSATTVNFDDVKPGALPNGWLAGVTGNGTFKWAVIADDSAPSKPNVLAQTAYGTFPFCVAEKASLKDGFVEVSFKPVSGKEDQAAGLIWRFKDKDNYYIARANAAEDEVTIYHTVDGVRRQIKPAEMKVTSNTWHTLRVDFTGDHFVVTFDGKKALDVTDTTFKDAGAVGVWTKADSVTHFDDFRYGPTIP